MIIAALMLIPKIEEQFTVSGFDSIPYVFTVGGIAIAVLGSYLLRKSKNYQNLKDEIH
jgi:LPXTG-motif cell wall-anchored protein